MTVLGAIARVVFAISVMSHRLSGDASWYHMTAAGLASGKGYITPSTGAPTAFHPPVFTCLLALLDLVDLHSVGAQRIAVSIVVSAGVLLVGLLGRKVSGAKVGIVAAVVAAISPLWFQSSGILMSESSSLVVIPGILLLALICIERPTAWRFGSLGLLVAIATLIRSEAILFMVLLGVPVIVFAAGEWRTRVQTGLALVAGFALILTPWLVRNEVQLGGVVLSTNSGVTIAGSYCPATFDPNQPSYGSFNILCAVTAAYKSRPPQGVKSTELASVTPLTTESETFARDHIADMPGVVLAREWSLWGFGDQNFQLALAVSEGRVRGDEQAGRIIYWALIPFVILGAVMLARTSRRKLVIVIAPLLVVAVNSAIFYGSTRMRTAAEPSLAVLGALGLVTAFDAIRSHQKLFGQHHAESAITNPQGFQTRL